MISENLPTSSDNNVAPLPRKSIWPYIDLDESSESAIEYNTLLTVKFRGVHMEADQSL